MVKSSSEYGDLKQRGMGFGRGSPPQVYKILQLTRSKSGGLMCSVCVGYCGDDEYQIPVEI